MTEQPFWNPKTELLPRDELRALQLAKLRCTVDWAAERSPHYRRAFAAAGFRPEQLTELTIYIVDVDDYKARAEEIGAVWREVIGKHYPAMAGVGVARLWDVAALVEVKRTATLPE